MGMKSDIRTFYIMVISIPMPDNIQLRISHLILIMELFLCYLDRNLFFKQYCFLVLFDLHEITFFATCLHLHKHKNTTRTLLRS